MHRPFYWRRRFNFNQQVVLITYGAVLPSLFTLGMFVSYMMGMRFLTHVRAAEAQQSLAANFNVKFPPRVAVGPEVYTFLGFYEAQAGKRTVLVRRELTGDIGAFSRGQEIFGGPKIAGMTRDAVEIRVANASHMIRLARRLN
jgi:hypothetical protein